MTHNRLLALACFSLGFALCAFPTHRALAQGRNDSLALIPKLLQTLDHDGFEAESGALHVLDPVGNVCAGVLPCTWYSNVQPYLVAQLPTDWERTDRSLPFTYLLRQDEAVLILGSTPPPMAYFSFQTFLFGRYKPAAGGLFAPYELPFAYVGDTVNSLTIQTTGSSPFNRPMALISTGNRETQEHLRMALLKSGYPAAVINTETLTPSLIRFGYKNADQFLLLMRTALPVGGDAVLDDYRNQFADPEHAPLKVFRVRPKTEFPPDPLPAPVLRNRGTGHTEMDLYPTMEQLRQAILDMHSGGFTAEELDSFVPWPEGYPAIQRDIAWMGPAQEGSLGYGRDANYLGSTWFDLPDNGFAIVYGVDHAGTGKATYASASVYLDEKFNVPVSSVDTGDFKAFPHTASSYLSGEPDAGKFYVWKVARNCNGEPNCMEAQSPCKAKIPLDAPVRIVFRAYAEPATKTGPIDSELIYDRVIVFRKK